MCKYIGVATNNTTNRVLLFNEDSYVLHDINNEYLANCINSLDETFISLDEAKVSLKFDIRALGDRTDSMNDSYSDFFNSEYMGSYDVEVHTIKTILRKLKIERLLKNQSND